MNNRAARKLTRLAAYAVVRQKTTFMFAEPEPQTCVRALFPHCGYKPCWYLGGHAEQRMD